MAEFKLGRIRFVWKGDWTGSTQYYIDDVVKYGGKTYICAVGHTSDNNFYTDLDFVPSKWNQMSDGQRWRDEWSVSTSYALNDVVRYGGSLYIANTAHTSNSAASSGSSGVETSTGLEADQAKWDLYAEGLDWKADWAISTRYLVGDLVRYGGYTYRCKTGHTSTADAALGQEADTAYWDTFNTGIDYKGAWAQATRYKANDVVKQGAGLWVVPAGEHHTSTADFAADVAAGSWNQFVEGLEFEDTWSISTPYQNGDIVRYGGNQYVSKSTHTGTVPTASGNTDWDLFAENYTFSNDWAIGTSYKIGEVVRLNGFTYRAKIDSSSITATVSETAAGTNIFTADDTTGMVANMAIQLSGTTFGNVFTSATYYIKTVDSGTEFTISTTPGGTVFTPTSATGTMTATVAALPGNATYWDQLNEGLNWTGTWTDDREYFKGDLVRFGANNYVCIQNHRSEADDGSTIGAEGGGADNSRPDQDVTGSYWNAFTVGSDIDVLSATGDLVYYSGAGPARLPIGTEGQVLVSSGTLPEWRTLGATDQVYYVAPHGTDGPAPTYGRTVDKPFKSIRYACEQVENGPRNPNAQYLLERNRIFLQRETSSYIEYQVANATPGSIWENFDFDEYKCERDVGFIIDRLIWDIGHGGNLKVRAAALSFVNGFSADGEFSDPSEDKVYGGAGLAAEAEQSVAAYGHLETIINSVLNNTAPATAYQDSNDSTAVAAQYIDTNYTTEAGVSATIATLMKIVTDTITAGDTSAIPTRLVPNVTINVKSGRYKEILPIIVPAETVILGDEVRSTNVAAQQEADSNTDVTDSYYSIETLKHIKGFIGNVVDGTSVTPTTGNTTSQDQTWPLADDAETAGITSKLVDVIAEQIDFKLGVKHTTNLTEPTGYNSSYLSGYGTAKKNIEYNKKFLQEEVIQYITNNFPTLKYSKTKCRQDVGYIVDAFSYDLTYGGNYQILNAAKAYWDGNSSTSALNSNAVTQTISAYNYLKELLAKVARSTTITGLQSTIPQYMNADAGASVATVIENNFDIILNTLAGDSTGADLPFVTVTTTASNVITTSAAHNLQVGDAFIPLEASNNLVKDTKYWIISTPAANTFTVSETFGGSVFTLTDATGLSVPAHVENYPAVTNAVSSTTALITAAETLDAQQEALVTLVDSYIDTNYPTLVYDEAKCKRDTRLILEAVMFDFMLGAGAINADSTNFATHIASLAYLRSTSSDVYTLGQKTATRAAFKYLATVIAGDTATYLNSDATAAARVALLMDKLDTIFYSATDEGDVCATEIRNRDYARLKLEENRDFIKAEVAAYIDDAFSGTITNTTITTDVITISDTGWLKRNAAIKFTGTTFGNIVAGTTYYVYDVVSATQFKIATSRYAGSAVTLTTASGSANVEMLYDETACARDVDTYIDALKWDLQWTSNYKSRYAARYYANAVTGSQEEYFYYLRNGTGVRNQTLDGLNGDLLQPNEYGTSRVSAGAYASLDPGWGPDDFRGWIISRSPYVQNVTTFGNAAIGQKIDGALHNGGNDSIVSNDFTQVISDGIGAWVANNGRAELVSVFTYYSHIGYLSTEGGRIRGTNGNNSYGDFGSVAEGFDSTETTGTSIVDNRLQFEATVGSVTTDGADKIFTLEYNNAGSEYTEADMGLFGAGSDASSELGKEIRDDAVFNVRLLDNVDDSTNAPEAAGNFGGFGYIQSANTAQGGTTTQITIAATDSQTSTAYIGMRVYLNGGNGIGQIGIIDTYNSGTKVATVTKPSTGAAGWDHEIPGTTISAPDASTTYVIQPNVTFGAPPRSETARTLAATTTWADLHYQNIFENYLNTAPNSTTGSGINATFDVFKKGTKYEVVLKAGGTGYGRLETVTILGTAVGGATPANDIVLTITSINSSTGAIVEFDKSGTSNGGKFIALPSATGNGTNVSADGVTWTTGGTLPATTTWTALAGGRMDKVVEATNFVTGRAYTITEPGDTPWFSIGASAILPGTIFEATGAGTFTSVAGKASENDERVIAIAGGTGVDDTAFSADGGATWTAGGNLPSTGSWNAVGYGANCWIAVKSGSTEAAISEDGGVSWSVTAASLPSTSTWDSVAYGGGYWVVLASGTNKAAWSVDKGATWTAVTLPSTSDWSSVAYGNNRFVAVSATNGTVAAYSIDGGQTWTASTLPSTAGWSHIEYGQGTFVAVSDGANYATSTDGIVWTARTQSETNGLVATAFGNPNQVGMFVGARQGSGNGGIQIKEGTRAQGRAFVATEKIFAIRITEPGSGYATAPTITITDPNNTFEAPTEVRIGKGALAQPSFKNRGSGYVTASADLNSGDGFADIFQSGSFIAVRRLSKVPAVGSNVVFGHLPDRTFKLVQVLTLLGENDGAQTAFLQIAPDMTVFDTPPDGTSVETRIRYSQVRLTGHDFLDIGTGGFASTNYPNTPSKLPNQANETRDDNGGRVFFTSTDQDGNFRVGDLFTIEQSTGVATLNADAFNISGLQELTLGEVTLGGNSASITEFSTDVFFSANSDNIVPTQRAIKAYISSQIGGGGAALNVNSVTAGFITIQNNTISTTTGQSIKMNATFDFRSGVVGLPIAFNYFLT